MKEESLKKILLEKSHFIFDVDETLYFSPTFSRERKKRYLWWYLKNSNLEKKEALEKFLSLTRKGLRFNEICKEVAGSYVLVQNQVLNEINVSNFVSQNKRLVKFIKMLGGEKYIFSDASRVGVNLTLNSLGFKEAEKHFSHIYTIDDFKLPKPTNYGLKKILSLHRLEPKSCIVFGDSHEYDIIPAKELGVTTIHINVRDEETSADFSFSSLEHFLDHAI